MLDLAGRTAQLGERFPARHERRIERDGTPIRLERSDPVAGRAIAMAPFLKQARKLRMNAFQARQRGERVGDPPEIALADSDEVEDIAILRHLGAQAGGRCEGLPELVVLHEPAYPPNFGLDGRFRWVRRRG